MSEEPTDEELNEQGSENGKIEVVQLTMMASRGSEKSEWCVDSGASSHMCKDRNATIVNSGSFRNRCIKMGDGKYLKEFGSGTIRKLKGGRRVFS